MSATPWRDDPDLAPRFHPQHPDDLQVVLHDGEPRRTQRAPEACWVTTQRVHGTLRFAVSGGDAEPPLTPEKLRWIERTVYAGKLLNAPFHLASARQGDTVLFIHTPGLPHPLRVTEGYLRGRPGWSFLPCDKCGTDQALDPPEVMARTRFPDMPEGALPVMFTAFCPCGGTMVVGAIEGAQEQKGQGEGAARKPWWKFW